VLLRGLLVAVMRGLVDGEGEEAADVALLAELVRRCGLIEGEHGIDVEPDPAVADGRAELGETSLVGCDMCERRERRGLLRLSDDRALRPGG
jgi:hypothetical protein